MADGAGRPCLSSCIAKCASPCAHGSATRVAPAQRGTSNHAQEFLVACTQVVMSRYLALWPVRLRFVLDTRSWLDPGGYHACLSIDERGSPQGRGNPDGMSARCDPSEQTSHCSSGEKWQCGCLKPCASPETRIISRSGRFGGVGDDVG